MTAGYGWVTLTTDFGLTDGFVAMLHGVLARHAPDVRVIDVTHDVHPGDLSRASAVLAQVVPHAPPAVHIAIVDPGVGTRRRGVAIRTDGGLLVGPDNGVLLPAADALGGALEAVELTNTDWHADVVSPTFHGRDIFAPVAARLARGAGFAEAGTTIETASLVRLAAPTIRVSDGVVEAEVLTVDRFGNVQLAVSAAEGLAALGGGQVLVGGHHAVCRHTFGEVTSGSMIVFGDSAGQLAIAVNNGLAVVELGVEPGDVVRLDRL
jgi:S-adenosylmethionine hydrolase